MDPRPRVSILIPNFNNGRASSSNRDRDFLTDLLTSLDATLRDDPTPLEIIIADDGSTDDSHATCRTWAKRTWTGRRADQPFCRLLEYEHVGVLSVVANRLVREACGDILVRLDGDIIIHTPNWAAALCRIFDAGPPDLGVVGPKQLTLDGRVHSFGDWILHPRGYHHIGQGSPRDALTTAMEVDHVMGCFYCWTRKAWETVGEFDESMLRGQTIDYGLRARRAGFRCFAVPTIEFTHCLTQRGRRSNVADSTEGVARTVRAFREKWGFCRLAPDLDAVAERYAGTPLLWNARVFGPRSAALSSVPGRAGTDGSIEASDWVRYGEDEAVQHRMHNRVKMVRELLAQDTSARRIVQLGCGTGLLCHLLANAEPSRQFIGVDEDPRCIEIAKTFVSRSQYPGHAPQYVCATDAQPAPVDDHAADLVLLLDVVEWHHNPVCLLNDAHRALVEGGRLAILTPQRATPAHGVDQHPQHLHPYRADELLRQVHALGTFGCVRKPDPQREGGWLMAVFEHRPSVWLSSSSATDARATTSATAQDAGHRTSVGAA